MEAVSELPAILRPPRERISRWSRKERAAVARKHFESIKAVIGVLERHKADGLEYRSVGSLPLEAQLGAKYVPVCSDGRIRDIDVIILADPRSVLSSAKQEISALISQGKVICSVDFITIHQVGYHNSRQLFPEMKRTENGGFALVFRDIEIELPTEAITHRERATIVGPDGSSVEFDAQSTETIYILFNKSFGITRPKDRKHMRIARRLSARRRIFVESNDSPLRAAIERFRAEAWKRHKYLLCAMAVYQGVDSRFFSLFGRHIIPTRTMNGLKAHF